MADVLLESISPAWILLAIIGFFWASAFSVVSPPRVRAVLVIFGAGFVGAALGQLLAEAGPIHDPMIGDAHLVVPSVVSLAAIAFVRRLVA